ncbi:hypothetical protein EV361DRAFT_398872 [Lentinula raphanica]|nr:hypothetical protein EV361DRAFT_398872 [Lentinula raphanica]
MCRFTTLLLSLSAFTSFMRLSMHPVVQCSVLEEAFLQTPPFSSSHLTKFIAKEDHKPTYLNVALIAAVSCVGFLPEQLGKKFSSKIAPLPRYSARSHPTSPTFILSATTRL